jgi:hypothetical protein
MGYNCLFTNIDVSVFRRSDGSLAFKGVLDSKLYLVNFSKENADLDACLIAKTNMSWLWHRRLAHVGMKNLHKLQPMSVLRKTHLVQGAKQESRWELLIKAKT